jgi:hypothetical protein
MKTIWWALYLKVQILMKSVNIKFGIFVKQILKIAVLDTVDPTIYLDTSKKFEKLKAIAVVSKGKMHRSNFQLEKQFFKSPLMLFEELNEAKTWMAEQLNYSNSSSLST